MSEVIRFGDWLQTFLGVKFHPLDPRVEDITIEDVAHSLAMQCRFNGHCREFYSVAEHSVHVSYLVPEEYALEGLLHDAAEAYLCDIPRPIKPYLREYKGYEQGLEHVVATKWNLTYPWPKVVMEWDNRILVKEAMDLMGPQPERWGVMDYFEPANIDLPCWTPIHAKGLFLARFSELMEKRDAARAA